MFDTVQFTLAAAVANDGTTTVSYPSGRSKGNYDWTSGKHVLFVNGNKHNAPADFTLTFNANASSITVTNKSGGTWAAGSTMRLQTERAGTNDRELNPADKDRVRMIEAGAFLLDLGSPNAADSDGFCASQDLTSAGVFSVNTTAAAAIAAAALAGTADVPRNVVAAWTGTAVLTITGKDEYGNTLVESSGSGTSLTGKKAFKTVTGISSSANITSLTVGTGEVLGLPVALRKADQVLAEYKDGVLLPRRAGKVFLPFEIEQTQLLAPTQEPLVCPVAGTISRLRTVVATAITGGGTLTVEVNDVAVNGLSVSHASGATLNSVGTDTPTAGHASTTVAPGDVIDIVPSAGFSDAGEINGVVEIDVTTASQLDGTIVVASTAEPTATTGDVRGTYDPSFDADGTSAVRLLVVLPDPDDKGQAQYAG